MPKKLSLLIQIPKVSALQTYRGRLCLVTMPCNGCDTNIHLTLHFLYTARHKWSPLLYLPRALGCPELPYAVQQEVCMLVSVCLFCMRLHSGPALPAWISMRLLYIRAYYSALVLMCLVAGLSPELCLYEAQVLCTAFLTTSASQEVLPSYPVSHIVMVHPPTGLGCTPISLCPLEPHF